MSELDIPKNIAAVKQEMIANHRKSRGFYSFDLGEDYLFCLRYVGELLSELGFEIANTVTRERIFLKGDGQETYKDMKYTFIFKRDYATSEDEIKILEYLFGRVPYVEDVSRDLIKELRK